MEYHINSHYGLTNDGDNDYGIIFIKVQVQSVKKKKGNIIFLARQTFFIFFNQHSARKKGTFCQNLNWKKKKALGQVYKIQESDI